MNFASGSALRDCLKPCSTRTCLPVATLALLLAFTPAVRAAEGERGLLAIMSEELKHSMEAFSEKAEPPPYFMLYQVQECRKTSLSAAGGALQSHSSERHRHLGVQVRVGDWQVDNTHRLRQEGRDYSSARSKAVYLPLEDDPTAVKTALWVETERAYRTAAERYIQVKTDRALTVDEEDQSADFTSVEPTRETRTAAPSAVDFAKLQEALRVASAVFNAYPEILESHVSLTVNEAVRYLATSDGTAHELPDASAQLIVRAQTRAADGMELDRSENFELPSVAGLPDPEALVAVAKAVAADLAALRVAPAIEPYSGPAILSGRAAAVFFHEIFGHRLEGQRQKDEEEGQTFTKRVGTAVLPEFVSITDDPTLAQYRGETLSGHYRFDDEGVAAQRVTLVEKGVLRGFLLSRSPVAGFAGSNGHGRGSIGRQPTARQGNLIVESSRTLNEMELRARLIEECRRQDKPFGLFFRDIVGGQTYTRRSSAQSYLVSPVMVYRVFVDGRPDELVRGASLIGTPLLALSEIIAFGDDAGVFNGFCGAESGWIRVSAVSPSFLTAKVEVQMREKSSEQPPLLPPPPKAGQ